MLLVVYMCLLLILFSMIMHLQIKQITEIDCNLYALFQVTKCQNQFAGSAPDPGGTYDAPQTPSSELQVLCTGPFMNLAWGRWGSSLLYRDEDIGLGVIKSVL